ncbi:hypothetical protein AV530_001834 [Patagioenas fasciata monilis]|uniref:Uncharacterized protein n=1 Tax=Patagioenas fasciata monilis TaxID=372326 RepID=A0A1V4JSK8_PATFA|nr:hypothetical protein AV530_001834 [Patagioenas fasciata monilis]
MWFCCTGKGGFGDTATTFRFLWIPDGNKPNRLSLRQPLAQVTVPNDGDPGEESRLHSTAFLLPALSAERSRLSPATQRSTNTTVKQGHKRMVYYRFTNTERIVQTEL